LGRQVFLLIFGLWYPLKEICGRIWGDRDDLFIEHVVLLIACCYWKGPTAGRGGRDGGGTGVVVFW
jgi:hypothetical protein